MKDNKHIESFRKFNENLNISDVSDSKKYFVITPEGEQITVEEYMKTSDYKEKVKAILAKGLSDEQKAELNTFFKK